MARTSVRVWIMFLAAFPSAFTSAANAKESYAYAGEGGFSTSFSLIGGEYSLYVYASRPIKGYSTPQSRSCIFSGNLQRVWPTHDAMSLGAGITISTIVPHKIGPRPVALIAGLYRLYVPVLTDCSWHFSLESTGQNPAGVAPVQMLKASKGGQQFSQTASMHDRVQFYAQYRTENDAKVPVSGVLQIIYREKVVQTFPLMVGLDQTSLASALYVDAQLDGSYAKYLGTATAKFVVKIGSAEFTSTGEFTLTE